MSLGIILTPISVLTMFFNINKAFLDPSSQIL